MTSTSRGLSDSLSSRHRWQLAWALVWPSFAFNLLSLLLAIGVVRRYFDKPVEDIYSACGTLLSLFVIGPWIVRRAMRINFPDFHLVAIRKAEGGETRALSYRESLSLAWLLSWRCGAIFGIVVGLICWAWWAFWGAWPPQRVGAIPEIVSLMAGNLFILALFYLWLVSAAIRKSYSDFCDPIAGNAFRRDVLSSRLRSSEL